jgi:hypothetical protein
LTAFSFFNKHVGTFIRITMSGVPARSPRPSKDKKGLIR